MTELTAKPRAKLPMATQPRDDGRGMPQPMKSRMNLIGPNKPARNDRARAAKTRVSALAKQRDALRRARAAKPLA